MHLPQPLYDALPVLYVTSGLVTLAIARPNVFGALSAATLVLAGGVIATWRYQHRARLGVEAMARRGFAQRRAKRGIDDPFHIG